MSFPLKWPVSSLAFSPDGKVLAAGCIGTALRKGEIPAGEVRLWDIDTGKELSAIEQDRIVRSAAYSPDGKLFAIACCGVQLYDAATRKKFDTLEFKAEVHVVTFSPDSKTLATSSGDGSGKVAEVRLWEVSTRKERAKLKGIKTKTWMNGLAFSPDGKTLAIGDIGTEDIANPGAIKLFDAATGEQRSSFAVQQGEIGHVAYTPNGKTLVVITTEGMLRLWDVGTGKEQPAPGLGK